MKISTSRAVLATAALLPSSIVAQQTTTECSSVHIFLAKGNNEPYPGRQGQLVTAICSGLDDCDYEDVQWQNMLEDEYCGAVEEGAVNGAAQIKAYNKRCPDTKLVLSGYSQGAQTIGDILGGGGGTFFQGCQQKSNPPLEGSSDAGKMIVAAMVFGDTRHTAKQSYNYLTGASKDGLFPRPSDQLSGLNEYADVLRNWCVETDPICAQGEVVETHLNYFDIYSDEAGAWVREMVDEASGGETSSKSSSSSSAASTKTSSSSSSEAAEETSTEAAENTTTEEETSTETSETTMKSTSSAEASTSTSTSTTGGDAEETTTTSSDSAAETSGDAEGDDDNAAYALEPSFGALALGVIGLLVLA
ncbi:cutinase domain-containing protein [Sarocladium implicatum]|nr:cutinase domain-containing protein [Sarocladium implicatum]